VTKLLANAARTLDVPGNRSAVFGRFPEVSNVYDDAERAQAYATLEFPGTYFLAFRDLPAIIAELVPGAATALDFGCGAGRSTRFLRRLGFAVVGVDIASDMVRHARAADPDGKYLVVPDGDLSTLADARFDVILSAFAFDNIAGVEHRRALLRALGRLLSDDGRIVLVGSTPDIYWHEWASFTTAAFPANRWATSGSEVRIVMKDVADRRPIVDTIWFDSDYQNLFAAAGLEVVAQRYPVGTPADGIQWLTEASVAPWVVYVVRRTSD
jgi:SAM-dependent methyltransferase